MYSRGINAVLKNNIFRFLLNLILLRTVPPDLRVSMRRGRNAGVLPRRKPPGRLEHERSASRRAAFNGDWIELVVEWVMIRRKRIQPCRRACGRPGRTGECIGRGRRGSGVRGRGGRCWGSELNVLAAESGVRWGDRENCAGDEVGRISARGDGAVVYFRT